MPLNRRTATRRKDDSSSGLQKLRVLEEMLEALEKLRQNPLRVDNNEAGAFRDRICALVAEAEELERRQDCGESGSLTPGSQEEELKTKIGKTIGRLRDANLSLVASIKAQQAILGDKIARLKDCKGLLKSYRPDKSSEPTLIDSNA